MKKLLLITIGVLATSCSLTPDQSASVPVVFQDRDLGEGDWSLHLYRREQTRESVRKFYIGLTRDEIVADAILKACDEYGLPPGLVFALAATESEFNPQALGRNARSQDYGLFQLNSRTYPDLPKDQAFDPVVNARLGASHLIQALRIGKSLAEGLAIYNAGPRRVMAGATPPSTKKYVAEILAQKKAYEDLFLEEVLKTGVLAQGQKKTKALSDLLDTASAF